MANSSTRTTERLTVAVGAVCPIDGVSVGVFGVSASVRIDFQAAATPAQRTAAQGVVDGFDWSPAAQATFDNLDARTGALALLTNPASSPKVQRAVLLVILDELNLHALKFNAILTAIDNSTTLANLKTAIAAIPDYPARTKAQLLTAITTKINAGDSDS